MNTYLINKENIEQIHTACVAYIEKHEYVCKRLSWQKDVLDKMSGKYLWMKLEFGVHEHIAKKLQAWRNEARKEFNTIADSFRLAKNIVECYNNAKECFEAMYVSSVDIEPILCEHSSNTN